MTTTPDDPAVVDHAMGHVDPDTAATIARDAAVRALHVALEHRFPAAQSPELEKCAAHAVDTFLTVGQLPWTILVEHGTEDQARLADAVMRINPGYRPEVGPNADALRDAATVIHTLIHDR